MFHTLYKTNELIYKMETWSIYNYKTMRICIIDEEYKVLKKIYEWVRQHSEGFHDACMYGATFFTYSKISCTYHIFES